jgi:spore maturation protein CgeB
MHTIAKRTATSLIPPWARVVVYSSASEDAVYWVLEETRGADLIIKASGVGVFDALLERAVIEMRRVGALAVFWDVDAPATLDRVLQNPDDPFRQLISHYDLILTYGVGEHTAAHRAAELEAYIRDLRA